MAISPPETAETPEIRLLTMPPRLHAFALALRGGRNTGETWGHRQAAQADRGHGRIGADPASGSVGWSAAIAPPLAHGLE